MGKIEKVHISHASNEAEIKKTVSYAVNETSFGSAKTVLLKPNFVCPRSSETGATTDLRLIEAVVELLICKGMQVTLGEGAGFEFDTDKVFDILAVNKIGEKYGIPIVNLRKAQTRCVNVGGKALKKIRLPQPVLDADVIVNLPKFKTHMLTAMTFAMKNFIGVLPDAARRQAHMHGIDQPVVDLFNYFSTKNILTIGDAITTMGGAGGPGYGEAIIANTLIWGHNNLAIDEVAFNFFGVDPAKIRYLQIAKKEKQFSDIEVIGSSAKFSVPFPVPDSGFLYKLSYRSMHTFDYLTSPFHKVSLIPRIATKIGIRVQIGTACNKCRKCIDVCPVGAISDEFKIDFEKCRYVRCLNCKAICPQNAIKIKGFLFSKSEDKKAEQKLPLPT